MELDEKFSGDLNDEQIKNQSNSFDATKLFNNAIFGDNTTILMGSSNVQNVTNKILKNDFDTLSELLSKQGISDEDIKSLKKAIENDKKAVNNEQKEYGPKVKKWIQLMFSKAVDGIWQIKLNVAGNLLSTALNNYYGWF